MCGRYSLSLGPDQLSSRVQELNMAVADILNGKQATISRNMGPTNYGAVYRSSVNPHDESENGDTAGQETSNDNPCVLQYMKWGLVPSFFKDTKNSYQMINCRAETLGQPKSVWAGPKKHNRCLIPVEGYYEWIGTGKGKIPYYVKRRDGQLIFLAGLWDRNTHADVVKDQKKTVAADIDQNENEKEPGQALFSYTIITTTASKDIEWLHERMPVIVDVQDKSQHQAIADWLNPNKIWNENATEFMSLIKPFDAANLEVYKVSTDVNKMGVNTPNLNKPLEASTFFSKTGKMVKKESDDKQPKEEQAVKAKKEEDKVKSEKEDEVKPEKKNKPKVESKKDDKKGTKRQATIPLESPAKRTRSHT